MLRYSATAVAYVADYGTPGRVDMGNVGLTALVSSPIPVSVLVLREAAHGGPATIRATFTRIASIAYKYTLGVYFQA